LKSLPKLGKLKKYFFIRRMEEEQHLATNETSENIEKR
jgi:hypothetical protein